MARLARLDVSHDTFSAAAAVSEPFAPPAFGSLTQINGTLKKEFYKGNGKFGARKQKSYAMSSETMKNAALAAGGVPGIVCAVMIATASSSFAAPVPPEMSAMKTAASPEVTEVDYYRRGYARRGTYNRRYYGRRGYYGQGYYYGRRGYYGYPYRRYGYPNPYYSYPYGGYPYPYGYGYGYGYGWGW